MKILRRLGLEMTAELETTKSSRRILEVALFLLVTIGLSSCDWYIFKPRLYAEGETPKICTDVLDHPPVTYEKLRPYSVDELLILQKCGLEYHPEHQFSWYIANQDEYPVPVLLKHLQSDDDEYFKYHLILDFVSLTESRKYRERILTDRSSILRSTEDAINKMTDEKIKQLSKVELGKIQDFFSSHQA